MRAGALGQSSGLLHGRNAYIGMSVLFRVDTKHPGGFFAQVYVTGKMREQDVDFKKV